jgi:hypothetical protein
LLLLLQLLLLALTLALDPLLLIFAFGLQSNMQPHYSDGPAMNPESRMAVSGARDGHQMPRDNRQGSRNLSAVAPMRSEGKIHRLFSIFILYFLCCLSFFLLFQ